MHRFVNQPGASPRRTKIVATLGPASDSEEVIRQLFSAGVDVFRMNASHGTPEEHTRRMHTVRAIARELDVHAATLLDLQGPKIRLGEFEGGGCVLKTGSLFVITTEPVLGNCDRATTTYANLPNDVKPRDRILLADGSVELIVLSSDARSVRCEVTSGGHVSSRKGINLPSIQVSTPSLTGKDMSDLQFGLKAGVDLLALSFVRSPKDVLRLRLYLEQQNMKLPIVAKIEKPEGWENLDGILEESDGVMVARGDLGVEMALEQVPVIQKSIIERARVRGKFVITATQMLESMIENALPTRAEASDVANAIFDGTDALMLSGETSIGAYPVEAVRMMARIARATETAMQHAELKPEPRNLKPAHAEIIADAAYAAARSAAVSAIVVFTSSGSSARLIARYRPPLPIYAFTPSDATARQLAAVYGVRPVISPHTESTDEMLQQMDRLLVSRRWVEPGGSVVFVAGQPIGRPGSTNMIKLHTIGERR
ncbi:MAG: pyruvate kinase [Bryobacterales bacterium]|nr:pyruvate kinase [Bryobacterales bacterium]